MSQLIVRIATADDAAGIARVKIDAWRDAYKAFLDPQILANLRMQRETHRWRDRLSEHKPEEPIWVALEQHSVLGFLVVGPIRYPDVPSDSELHAIYIHPSAQRKGVGRALLSEGVRWLQNEGYKSMAVFVFKENVKGTNFYKSVGAQLHDAGEFEVGGRKYPDESYVWPSLEGLRRTLEGSQ